MKPLNEYPKAIADKERLLLEAIEKGKDEKRKLEKLLLEIEGLIAYDSELKNEQQRKVRKSELLKENYQHEEITRTLEKLEKRKREIEIQLDLLKNEFSVAKLEVRMKYAEMLQTSEY
jgi:hypothetical protein